MLLSWESMKILTALRMGAN